RDPVQGAERITRRQRPRRCRDRWVHGKLPCLRGASPMIASIVTFRLPQAWTVEQAAEAFRSTAPKYLGMPGLVRKHYYVSESGDRAGGIYFWESRAAAEACYTQQWRDTVAARYGSPPEILFIEVPVTVDNVTNAIEAG